MSKVKNLNNNETNKKNKLPIKVIEIKPKAMTNLPSDMCKKDLNGRVSKKTVFIYLHSVMGSLLQCTAKYGPFLLECRLEKETPRQVRAEANFSSYEKCFGRKIARCSAKKSQSEGARFHNDYYILRFIHVEST